MEQVVLPKSNRKIYYQIFKGISFIDLFIFSSFLITSILIAYLLPNLILKWIITTITILIGCLSLVKNYNETRVYNTIFNAIKYSISLLLNRKVIVKSHYFNTSSVEVLQFNYKKRKFIFIRN